MILALDPGKTHFAYAILSKKGLVKTGMIRNVIDDFSKDNLTLQVVRFVRELKPIVLAQLPDGLSLDGESDVTDCKLDELLHDSILKRAVELAISTRGHVNK